jgi:hypothetical protein
MLPAGGAGGKGVGVAEMSFVGAGVTGTGVAGTGVAAGKDTGVAVGSTVIGVGSTLVGVGALVGQQPALLTSKSTPTATRVSVVVRFIFPSSA